MRTSIFDRAWIASLAGASLLLLSGCTGEQPEAGSASTPTEHAPTAIATSAVQVDLDESGSPADLAGSVISLVSSAATEGVSYSSWLDAVRAIVADDGQVGETAVSLTHSERDDAFRAAVPISTAEWERAQQLDSDIAVEFLTPVGQARLLNNSGLETYAADIVILAEATGEEFARATVFVELYCDPVMNSNEGTECVVYSMRSAPL